MRNVSETLRREAQRERDKPFWGVLVGDVEVAEAGIGDEAEAQSGREM